jgi:uncharacterized protein
MISVYDARGHSRWNRLVLTRDDPRRTERLDLILLETTGKESFMTDYHMQRQDKAITDTATLQQILASGQFAVIAIAGKTYPYTVTMNYGYDPAQNSLFFHCASKGLKLDMLRKNPMVCATIIEDLGFRFGECDHGYRSLVIRGKMTEIQDFNEKCSALRTMLQHLEKDPDRMAARIFKNPARIQSLGMLKLSIEQITGKQG